MIALERLKRAISDAKQRNGMLTGTDKVHLKLPDAERIVLEVEHLQEELEFFIDQSIIIEHKQDHERMRAIRKKYGRSI